ncbi:MAG TPA: tail fiber domain-containing protein [Polyangiaceae bacterium]|nr:tail fiber domain-containing protein [Polyangiaceae bacterium]
MKLIVGLTALVFVPIATLAMPITASADCNSSSSCLSHYNSGLGAGLSGTSSGNVGVQGYARNSANTNFGAGTGVLGISGNGIGVEGTTTQTGGYGVYGHVGGSSSYGVKAEADSSSNTALWVVNTSGNSAAWFDGNVYINGTNITPSDARLKKDVADIPLGLKEALQLRPVTYKWISGQDDRAHLGLIAQEVQRIVPQLVTQTTTPEKKEILGVNYPELVPILLKAIQEQNARIVTLENSNAQPRLASLFGGGALGLLPAAFLLAKFARKKRAETRA